MKNFVPFQLTIGRKLIGLLALLLVSSIGTIVYQSTRMYVNNDKENIRVSNVEISKHLSIQVREIFGRITDNLRYQGELLLRPEAKVRNFQMNPGKIDDQDILGYIIHQRLPGGHLSVVRSSFSSSSGFSAADELRAEKLCSRIELNRNFSASQLFRGESQVLLVELPDSTSAFVISIPLVQSDNDPSSFTHAATAIIRPSLFSSLFSQELRGTSFLVDHRGLILAHHDSHRIGEDSSQIPVVKEFLSGTHSQNLVPYTDPTTHELLLASYNAVGFAGLGIVTEVPESLAYQAATTMGYRSLLVGLVILFIAFWAGYLYSRSITDPIQTLVSAAQQIARGDFKINLIARGQDEVSHLSTSFNEMARGLEERDRVKETFNKFHNKEIADRILSGEVKLGGERRQATIFFSDIRGFTAMSESMQPEQVVELLNEYMSRMVGIIRKNHGVVDKYVGDAIMAIWGVPFTGNDDTYNAIRACLEMRIELSELNTLRIDRGQPPIRIGMGLNVGPVIAGNIGSNEKMEYTVIGDSVNVASRMESMTKEYGTDLLVSQSIYKVVQNRFIFEPCKSAKVKGKSAAIAVYRVKGYYDDAGNPVEIETPYSSHPSEKSEQSENHLVQSSPSPATPVTSSPPQFKAKLPPPPTTHQSTSTPAPRTITELEGYYVRLFGEVLGPFTELEVRQGARAGDFPTDASVSKGRTENWTSIQQYTENTKASPPPPPFRKAV